MNFILEFLHLLHSASYPSQVTSTREGVHTLTQMPHSSQISTNSGLGSASTKTTKLRGIFQQEGISGQLNYQQCNTPLPWDFATFTIRILFPCCSDSDEKLPQGVGKRKVSTVTFADEGARNANIPDTILR